MSEPSTASAAPATETPLRSRVLLVDDQPIIVEAVRRMLAGTTTSNSIT